MDERHSASPSACAEGDTVEDKKQDDHDTGDLNNMLADKNQDHHDTGNLKRLLAGFVNYMIVPLHLRVKRCGLSRLFTVWIHIDSLFHLIAFLLVKLPLIC